MVQIANTALLVGGGLLALFAILLSLPHSRLRDFLMPIVGWCFALFCGAYICCPIDMLPEALMGPFGLVDDFAAAIAGICAASSAIKAAKAQRQLP